LGNFTEGKCLQVFTNKPGSPNISFNAEKDNGILENWIICLDEDNKKENLIEILIQLKLLKQQKEEQIKKENNGIKPRQQETLNNFEKKLTGAPIIEKRKDFKDVDGYWILLQDWVQCSLKCGGGKSYQQWMCVPPKAGGRNCEGPAIRTKDCNTHPCPGDRSLPGIPVVNDDLHEVAKPIIKSLPFSQRKQNFIKCVIKESDIFYLKKNPFEKTDKLLPMPSRIVMNNRTISVFDEDSYDHAVFTFELSQTELTGYEKDACCFNLVSNSKQFTICGGFGESCQGFVNEWNHDFTLFKQLCYVDMKEYNWKEEQMKEALQDALGQANVANLEERTSLINKKLHEKDLSLFEKNIIDTQNTALKAIKKELNIEKLVQQEVQLKSMLETKNLIELKKREQKKKECLERALHDRDVEDERLRENKQLQLQIQKIKEEAQKQVEEKRKSLRNKIAEIKTRAARRKKLIEQDINTIRGQMAQNLIDANRNGDENKCKNSYGNQDKINYYCNTSVYDDLSKNLECKDPSNFCYICCETEFGNMIMDKRDHCYEMCDYLASNELKQGEFTWNK
jgi:hypothetical protein